MSSPDDLDSDEAHVGSIESALERAQLVQNTAQRPNVCLVVVLPPLAMRSAPSADDHAHSQT